jgi:hypothetical protein
MSNQRLKQTEGKLESLIPHDVATEILSGERNYKWSKILDDLIISSTGEDTVELSRIMALLSITKVLNHTQSIGKYPKHSWKMVDEQLIFDAFLRHFNSYLIDSKSCDSESGLHHLDHVFCNAMFLLWNEIHN